MRILVTGAFGRTAISIIEALHHEGHTLTGFDLPTASCPKATQQCLENTVVGDIARFEDIEPAVRDVQAIVHLAVACGDNAYHHPHIPFAVNVTGACNLFEAARRHHIDRIVHMSSAAVHVPLDGNEALCALTDWKSNRDEDSLYDLTKRLQEEIARDFCATHQMNVVVLRAGHIVDGRQETDLKGRPLTTVTYCRGGWICRYDLATACVKALASTIPGYTAYHIIGASRARRHFDIDRTEQELGLICQHRFEQYT